MGGGVLNLDWYRTLVGNARKPFWAGAAGRAVGAFFPFMIGVLAACIGLTGAILFGLVAYGLALVSLIFLPETRGKELVALD